MSNNVTIYRGRSGADGVAADNGLAVTDVDAELVESPVFDVLCTNKLSRAGSIDWARNSISSHVNRHQRNVWNRADETTNYVAYSNDFSNWTDVFTRWTIIGTTTDPFGGSDATEINLDVNTDDLSGIGEVMGGSVSGAPSTANVAVSFWIKVISGTVTGLDVGDGVVSHTMTVPTASYQRVTKTLNSTSTNFVLSIDPRGLSGARIAVYGVQLENNNTATDLIDTSGGSVAEAFLGETERESDDGWLIEEEKENVVHFSGDLAKWTPTNSSITTYTDEDPFNVTDENIAVVWSSVSLITLSSTTESLSASAAYTVSFWAYVTAGSLTSLTVSLGGGTAVTMPTVTTTGFTRISASLVAGSGSGIIISATSPNLTAALKISGVQAELGTLTSYIKTGTAGQTRLSDIVSCDYAFNIPRPDLSWTFTFRFKNLIDDSNQKFVFTNNETGSTEFSCYFTNQTLTLKNGSSTTSIDATGLEKIAMTFDGSTLTIYSESTSQTSASITPTTFLATTMYIGMNSAEAKPINAHISNFMFYDTILTANELKYLMGA